MFEKMSESEGNVVGFRAVGHLHKEDYQDLTDQVHALVNREGAIGLLFDCEKFESEGPGVWATDFKFGQTFRNKIKKLAIVGDKGWQHLLANLADPFYGQESKFFHTADRAAAWEWLKAN